MLLGDRDRAPEQRASLLRASLRQLAHPGAREVQRRREPDAVRLLPMNDQSLAHHAANAWIELAISQVLEPRSGQEHAEVDRARIAQEQARKVLGRGPGQRQGRVELSSEEQVESEPRLNQ